MTERVFSIAFVDVGQGDATILLPPAGEGDAVVVDCGRDGWEVAQQLKAWGVERLEAVIASHLDLDHVGGMMTVLDAYRGKVQTVYFSPDRDLTDEHDDAKRAKELTDAVVAGGAPGGWNIVPVVRDMRPVSSGHDWSIEVLAPRGSKELAALRNQAWDKPNEYSAVVRVRMGGKSVLIGGDAPLVTWAELEGDELASEVFRVPHHGGAIDDGGIPEGWSAERLYDVVRPRVAALSVGTNNGFDHPETTKWTAPLIGRPSCRLLCTQVTGRCHPPIARGLEAEPRKRAIHAIRQGVLPLRRAPYGDTTHFAEPPWRHYSQVGTPRSNRLEIPCAGTISVRIDSRGDMMVDPTEEHASLAARIGRWESPLCRRASPPT